MHNLLARRRVTYSLQDGAFITKSDEFRFDVNCISRIRVQMQILIQRLSYLYLPWKQEKEEQEKRARELKLAKRSRKATTLVVPPPNPPPPVEPQTELATLRRSKRQLRQQPP